MRQARRGRPASPGRRSVLDFASLRGKLWRRGGTAPLNRYQLLGRRMKNFHLVYALLFFVTPFTQAANYYGPPRLPTPMAPFAGPPQAAPATQVADSPEALVRQGVRTLTDFLKGRTDRSSPQVQAFLRDEIAPYFDFAYMTRKAAGPLYRRLSTRERVRMEERIQGMFLKTLAENLGTYRGQDVRIFTERASRAANQVSVAAWLLEPQGYPTKLEFKFYRAPDGTWTVYDVNANGNSAVMYYRTYIQRMVRQYGPRWLES